MRDLVTAAARWTWRVFGPLLERLASVGLVQSAVVLAAQTFLALFPLLMAVAAIAPPGMAGALRHTYAGRLGLTGQADQAVQTLLGLVSRVVMPRTIHSNEQRYGTIGVVFAVESWLVVVAGVIVAAAVVAAMVAQQTWGPRWARLWVPTRS